MLSEQAQADLTWLNTLALPCQAAFLLQASGQDEVNEACAFARAQKLPLLPLGGGSNLVLPPRLQAVVLQQQAEPLADLRVADSILNLRVSAGYNWSQLVTETTNAGWFGLENLALIPGTAGAAPVQNIGAYGVEIADCLQAVEGIWLKTGQRDLLPARDCRLAYRMSRFKQEWKGQFVITAIYLHLQRQAEPRLDYANLQAAVLQARQRQADQPLPSLIAEVISGLRRSKLPDPQDLPNAGSFFKNPVVALQQARHLKAEFPELPLYPLVDGCKLAAGWLIEHCGFKGQRQGAVAMHEQQALVMVNHGGASQADVLQLADRIQQAVLARFGVLLEIEPDIWPGQGFRVCP